MLIVASEASDEPAARVESAAEIRRRIVYLLAMNEKNNEQGRNN